MKSTRTHEIIFVLILLISISSTYYNQVVASQISKKITSYGRIEYNQISFGVVSHPWTLTEDDVRGIREIGATYLRIDFVWSEIEPIQGSYKFSKYDIIVNWAITNDITIIASLNQIPSWLVPQGGDAWTIPTGDDYAYFVQSFGQFIYTLADHYKGDVRFYEIWNEANRIYFWNDTESLVLNESYNRGLAIKKYVTLLKEAYEKGKLAYPDCKILSSISENDNTYLQEMYTLGAKDYFDFLGLHPYFWHGWNKNYDPDHVNWDLNDRYAQFPKISLIRDVMNDNGDGGKKIFITELGVGLSDGPEGPTTEQMQADRLNRVIEKIYFDPGYPYIEVICWYQWRDTSTSPSQEYGLLRENGTPRLQYYAYENVVSP